MKRTFLLCGRLLLVLGRLKNGRAEAVSGYIASSPTSAQMASKAFRICMFTFWAGEN